MHYRQANFKTPLAPSSAEAFYESLREVLPSFYKSLTELFQSSFFTSLTQTLTQTLTKKCNAMKMRVNR